MLLWPLAGLLIAIIIAFTLRTRVTPGQTMTAIIVSWVLVLAFTASPVGTRTAAFLAGLLCAVPCLVDAPPLARALMACLMVVPWAAASALVVVPPIPRWRERIAYLATWAGTRQVKPRPQTLDSGLLFRLIVATLVFAAALATVTASPEGHLGWLLVRWAGGGVAALAFAEMVTAALPLVSALFGLSVPALMESPWLSTSVSEFWTRRWNIVASQTLFGPYFFAPLARRSPHLALFLAFAVSGLGHWALVYMALGRMGPALACAAFFVVQPLLILAERRLKVRRWSLLARHLWTITVLAALSPLLVEPVLQVAGLSYGVPASILLPTAAVLAFIVGLSAAISFASLAACPSGRRPRQPAHLRRGHPSSAPAEEIEHQQDRERHTQEP